MNELIEIYQEIGKQTSKVLNHPNSDEKTITVASNISSHVVNELNRLRSNLK
jgi:hypothetical protein